MFRPIREPDHGQRGGDVLLALAARQIGEEQRHFDVALGAEHREQVVELEDEADVPRAPFGELSAGEPVDSLAGHLHFALVGAVEPADQVQQRGLARAGGTHQGQELTGGHLQVDAVQHLDLLLAARIALDDVLDGHDRRHAISPWSPARHSLQGPDRSCLRQLLRIIRRKPRFAAFLLSFRRCANHADRQMTRLQCPQLCVHCAV